MYTSEILLPFLQLHPSASFYSKTDKRVELYKKVSFNKHCEILVSCSDQERNCIQAHETACKLIELHVSSLNFVKS